MFFTDQLNFVVGEYAGYERLSEYGDEQQGEGEGESADLELFHKVHHRQTQQLDTREQVHSPHAHLNITVISLGSK